MRFLSIHGALNSGHQRAPGCPFSKCLLDWFIVTALISFLQFLEFYSLLKDHSVWCAVSNTGAILRLVRDKTKSEMRVMIEAEKDL